MQTVSNAEDHQGTRRDFIYYATAGAGAVVTGAAVWPLVNQMNPSADVLALASIRVDVGAMSPGSQMTVLWQGKPVFIRYRTEEEIALARSQDEALSSMPDRFARNENREDEASALDENRTLDENGEWLVQMGVCTHLGCVPLGDSAGDFEGWFLRPDPPRARPGKPAHPCRVLRGRPHHSARLRRAAHVRNSPRPFRSEGPRRQVA